MVMAWVLIGSLPGWRGGVSLLLLRCIESVQRDVSVSHCGRHCEDY